MRLARARAGSAPPRRAAPPAGAQAGAEARPRAGGGTLLSTAREFGPADTVGGLLAALSIFVGALALFDKPVRLAVASVLLALVASRMTDRWDRLVQVAIALSVVWFVGGMTVAVLTESALY